MLRLVQTGEDARVLSAEGTEVWIPCPLFKSYFVSNLGRVYSSKRSCFLSPFDGGSGYLSVVLQERGEKKTTLLHRLVLSAFDGPPPGEKNDARHVYSPDRADARLCNLAWGTRSENMADVWRHRAQGFAPRTSTAPLKKPNSTYALDPRLVELGLEFYAEGKLTRADLCRLWQATKSVTNGVVDGETWKHILRPSDINSKRTKRSGRTHHLTHLTEEGLSSAFVEAATCAWSAGQFAKHLGISTHTARQIWRGDTWKHVPRPPQFLSHLEAISRAYAQMDDATAQAILDSHQETGRGAPWLARKFNKSTSTISALIARKTYRHLTTTATTPTPTSAP